MNPSVIGKFDEFWFKSNQDKNSRSFEATEVLAPHSFQGNKRKKFSSKFSQRVLKLSTFPPLVARESVKPQVNHNRVQKFSEFRAANKQNRRLQILHVF
jgi:hypothetical protein